MSGQAEVIVAGHICLDVIPDLSGHQQAPPETSSDNPGLRLTPGTLLEIGPATIATGGAVANTGLALHRLGVRVSLRGKVGDDLWGRAILDRLEQEAPRLSSDMIISRDEHTSYSVVMSLPDTDRTFLHHPGVNNTFTASEISFEQDDLFARVFHFGYPPLMANMYQDGGDDLADLFKRAKDAGLVTSLDMAMPDPATPAGRADWRGILSKTLPYVDVFLPSLDEMLLTLRTESMGCLETGDDVERDTGEDKSTGFKRRMDMARDLAGELLGMGAGIVGLKLGAEGLYVQTAPRERFTDMQWVNAAVWAERDLHTPAFQVNAVNATGAGDTTVAGFLAGMLAGDDPETTMKFAVGVGGHCVEAPDAVSGIVSAEAVRQRIAAGWPQALV